MLLVEGFTTPGRNHPHSNPAGIVSDARVTNKHIHRQNNNGVHGWVRRKVFVRPSVTPMRMGVGMPPANSNKLAIYGARGSLDGKQTVPRAELEQS